jgi:hypothetical protein
MSNEPVNSVLVPHCFLLHPQVFPYRTVKPTHSDFFLQKMVQSTHGRFGEELTYMNNLKEKNECNIT